ncbi:flagellar basal body P-ring protein FlgI [Magnetococcus sp. PR-3]|uniref:flagellar basal body P-ring protein FlgI n=1 Tax=Magnetococcus sp. PR-3 TaxID=3120355 RepID=UPI002FCE165B
MKMRAERRGAGRLGRFTVLALSVAMGMGAMLSTAPAEAARLKDIVAIEGVRDNPLNGYGLLVGLNGTGDSSAAFTQQSMQQMLQRMGISMNTLPKVKNVAAVVVTATLPPFARQGNKLDVTLSSLGDAKSLEGGTLVMTPLRAADGRIYAVAQGPVSVGGFSAGGGGGNVQKNHPTVARISGGATVEREVRFNLARENNLQLSLNNHDFTTANRVVRAINSLFGEPLARATDSGTVKVQVPASYRGRVVEFISRLEAAEVEVDTRARVVVNERTGTIVMGENVRVSTVALSHGSLSIRITDEPQVSQPNALAGGETAVVNQRNVEATEQDARLIEMEEGVTLGDLVKGLNNLGVTPRDLIAILQAIKASGALQADLETM